LHARSYGNFDDMPKYVPNNESCVDFHICIGVNYHRHSGKSLAIPIDDSIYQNHEPVLIALQIATAQPTYPQLLTNGGFETGDTSFWTDTFSNLGTLLTVAASSSIPGGSRSGSFSGPIVQVSIFLPDFPTDWFQTIDVPQACSATQ
jgi:hypothetical protein